MIGNINIIIQKLSKKTGKSVEYYTQLSDYLFNKIKYELEESLEGGLFLRKIGTWTVDGYHLRWMIYSTIKRIREYGDDTKAQNAKKRDYEKLRYLLKLRNIMSHYYVEHRRPYMVKKIKRIAKTVEEHNRRNAEMVAEDQARMASRKVGEM